MSFKLTQEQETIVDAVRKNASSIDVDALAGAAKSTTLKVAAQHITSGRNLALAFNVGIKESLAQSLPSNFDVLTMNGLGHRAWQKFLGGTKLQLEKDKSYRICSRILTNEGYDGESLKVAREELQSILSAARAHGLVPTGNFPVKGRGLIPDTPEGWMDLADIADLDISASNLDMWMRYGREALIESCNLAFGGKIDFADQIYMPTCFSGAFPRYDRVLVDEAQDLSPLNHIQLNKCVAGTLMVVGDERQSIYAFRGADSDSIPKLRAKFATETFALTTTFRCAKKIVENVHWRAPAMKAADWAPEGEVLTWKEWNLSQIPPRAFIICRNNAPLISLGFKMLARGISIAFQGGDTGRQLTNFIRKISNGDLSMSAGLFYSRLDKWEADEIRAANDRASPSKIERIADKAAMCRALPGNTAGEILKSLETILNNKDGQITLMSGHKSKGLEADSVIHLNPHLVPSRFAQTPRAKLQEDNLKYVIETRPKRTLIHANSDLLED